MDVAGRLAVKPPCDACRAIWAEKEKEPPCAICMPELSEENREAWEVWQLVQGQVITAGMGEVIDIDFRAIEIAMNMLEVEAETRREVFFKVVEIARAMRNKKNEKNGI